MIDRGALVLSRSPGERYRGPHRGPLDSLRFTGRKGRELAQRYQAAIVAGEGVLEDLDLAIALMREGHALGVNTLEVLVFEVPQSPLTAGSLPVLEQPPADDLTLLGWDVIEAIEPYHSPLSSGASGRDLNPHGLLARRAEAEALAATMNQDPTDDQGYVAARVWLFNGA